MIVGVKDLGLRCLEYLQVMFEEDWTYWFRTDLVDDEVTLRTDYVDGRLLLC